MKEFPPLEKVRELVELDSDNLPRWKKTRGPTAKAGAIAFTTLTNSPGGHRYYVGSILGRPVTRAQVVFALANGRWPIGEVRRLDGNDQNDDPANLVDVTTDPRGRSRSRSAARASKHVGVTWRKGQWCARRCINGKTVYLGDFANEDDAARAYDEAGERITNPTYAPLRNFPDEVSA